MKKKIGSLLLAMTLAVSGCALLPQEEAVRTTPVVRTYAGPEYTTVTVMRGDIQKTVQMSATYLAVANEKLMVKDTSRAFTQVYLRVGDTVEPGDIIASQDISDLEARLDTCRAELTKAEMNLAQLTAERDLKVSQREALFRILTYSQRENYETPEEVYESWQPSIDRAQDVIDIKNLQIGELLEQVRGRQLIAGISGTITQIANMDEQGYLISRLVTAVAIVSDIEKSYFRANTEYHSFMTVGSVYPMTISSTVYDVQVVEAPEMGSDGKDPADEKQYVYLRLLEPEVKIERGTVGSVRVLLDERKDCLYLKYDAVMTEEDGRTLVYVMDENNILQIRYVETGLNAGSVVEIVSGLAEGDQVVLPSTLK